MASAKTATILPLDRAAALCGIHPLHFNQVHYGDRLTGCGEVWLQYDWQRPSLVSRESFAQAIAQAENDLEQFLGFPLAPKWYTVTIPVTGSPIVLPKAHFIDAGIPKTIKVGTYPIVYTDADSDGYDETATITIPPNLPADELYVTYPDEPTDWQIKPVKIGPTTITMARHQLVKKDLLESLSPAQVQGEIDTNFLATVDVYCTSLDPSVQATIYGPCRCGNGCQTCVLNSFTACMTPGHHKDSILNLTKATWSSVSGSWIRTNNFSFFPWGLTWPYNNVDEIRLQKPVYATVTFRAGWTGPNIWDEAILYLALSRLSSGLCQCPTVKDKLEWWSTDLTKRTREVSYRVAPRMAEYSPWGYTRGAIYAFSLAWKYKMPQGN